MQETPDYPLADDDAPELTPELAARGQLSIGGEVVREATGTLMTGLEPLPPAHIMLDLETWGNGNKAVIVSIGACKFTRDEITDRFHVGVDPASCHARGLEIDADTILWWMDPERREALDEWLKLERVDLASALLGFSMWAESGPGILAIWGNGSTFDNVILRSAYKATGQEYPVKFWQDQCYRTMKNLTPHVPIQREGTHHDALDDAITQARHLQAIWRELDQEPLRAQLERNAEQFEFYAQQHRNKLLGALAIEVADVTEEKARVNEQFAVDNRRLLGIAGPVAP